MTAAAVRWGLLSTASIGGLVLAACRRSPVTRFVAVASRDGEKARRFAAGHGLERSFGSYSELLASGEVDAVYVALPVSMHTEWTVAALRAGKHVLCEKPFAVTAADAGRAFDAVSTALAAGVAPPFGRVDAVAQAGVLEAVRAAAERGEPVPTTG